MSGLDDILKDLRNLKTAEESLKEALGAKEKPASAKEKASGKTEGSDD